MSWRKSRKLSNGTTTARLVLEQRINSARILNRFQCWISIIFHPRTLPLWVYNPWNVQMCGWTLYSLLRSFSKDQLLIPKDLLIQSHHIPIYCSIIGRALFKVKRLSFQIQTYIPMYLASAYGSKHRNAIRSITKKTYLYL